MATLFPPQNTFIFRPGAPQGRLESGSPVYNDFTRLYADLSATAGAKELVFDDSLSSPCTIPAGSYDMSDVTWRGGRGAAYNGGPNQVTFAAGVIITNATRFINLVLEQTVTTTGAIFRYNSGGTEVVVAESTTFQGFGASLDPLIQVSTGSSLNMTLKADSGIAGSTSPMVEIAASGDTGQFTVLGDSGFTTDVLGPVGSVLTLNGVSSAGLSTPATPPTSFLGTYTFNRISKGEQVEIDPSGLPSVSSVDVQGAISDLNSMGVQTNAVYVSKSGNDSNSGLSPALAKLTIGSAITAASGLTPTTSNRVTISVLDAGIYTESTGFNLPNYVSLIAPTATITTGAGSQNLVLGEQSHLHVGRLLQLFINGSNVTTRAWIHGDFFQNTSSSTFATGGSTNGIFHFNVEYMESNAIGIATGQSTSIQGRVGTLVITGANNAISINNTGHCALVAGCIIASSGTAIFTSNNAVTLDLVATYIEGGVNAYNVNNLATLNVVVARRVGTVTGTGTVNEVKAI